MKYKVTITSTDLTGHEDEPQVFENQTEYDASLLIEKMPPNSKLTIEPMAERQKVTVWFYVTANNKLGNYSTSNLDKRQLEIDRDIEIKRGRKVSEIKSMEVEI